MTCRTDECCQGDRPCPTPSLCADEPLSDPDGMLAITALVGVLALACAVGMATWFLYAVWPVLVAAIG